MSVFLLQDRELELCKGTELNKYPSSVKYQIEFGPLDAFGIDGELIRTTFKVGENPFTQNLNDGTVEWHAPLIDKLQINLDYKGLEFKLNGNILTFIVSVESKEQLIRFGYSANSVLPAVLSFRLQTFVSIRKFSISTESGYYRLFVTKRLPPKTAVTEESSIDNITNGCKHWLDLKDGDERIIYAMHLYRQAIRLSQIEPSPQTMFSETIINLSKALEVLFHGSENTKKFVQKAISSGLSKDFIDSKLTPIVILRNKLGCAHNMTSPLTVAQKKLAWDYQIKAFNNVQYTINFIWEKHKKGEYTLEPVSSELNKERINILSAIENYVKISDMGAL